MARSWIEYMTCFVGQAPERRQEREYAPRQGSRVYRATKFRHLPSNEVRMAHARHEISFQRAGLNRELGSKSRRP
eukprot:4874477-Pleurochrysis_carterae.AAC.1